MATRSLAGLPPPRVVAGAAEDVGRRHDLDLLRVALVFGLVFFHTARIFDTLPLPEGVKNDVTSPLVTLVVVLCALWAMPLMFVIAGFSIRRSLRRRTGAAFLRERVERLLIPFVFGVLVVVPPQVYVHVLQAEPGSQPGYLAFLRRYFDPGAGLFTTAHLWFLGDLFLFSALLLPLFLALRLPAGERRLAALAGWLARPAAIWLLALPIALVDIALGAVSNGGWRQETFAVFLLCGYLLATDPRYAEAMGRAWRPALAAGLLLALVYAGGAFYLSEAGVDPTRDYDWGSVAWRALKSLGAWAWMIAILGFGSRPRTPHGRERGPGAARPGGRALAYAGEAFLPFYILHQTIVFVIGYFVVQWAIAAPLKYLAISLPALAATLLLYELAIRRFAPCRRLFGLRPAPYGASSYQNSAR